METAPERLSTDDVTTIDGPADLAGTPNAAAPTLPRKAATPIWPGLIGCGVVGLVAVIIGLIKPALSPMLLAIIAGALIRNLVQLPAIVEPGISVAAKKVLRWGVVLLGLQVSLHTIAGLGAGVLILVCCAVGITFFATKFIGHAMGIDSDLVTLIASGFSICGAAAVAGVQGAIRTGEEKVAAAVALVVLYGTLMIPVTAGLADALGLGSKSGGVLIGGSTHEVAQVVAAAGVAGGGQLLAIAVTVKLARVCLMAPIVGGISLLRRRNQPKITGQKRPALVPLFVIGFIVMVLIATTHLVPAPVLADAKILQQFLLATAMFALGLGVHVKSLVKLGLRPVLLGLLATLVIMSVVLIGISLGV